MFEVFWPGLVNSDLGIRQYTVYSTVYCIRSCLGRIRKILPNCLTPSSRPSVCSKIVPYHICTRQLQLHTGHPACHHHPHVVWHRSDWCWRSRRSRSVFEVCTVRHDFQNHPSSTVRINFVTCSAKAFRKQTYLKPMYTTQALESQFGHCLSTFGKLAPFFGAPINPLFGAPINVNPFLAYRL